MTVSIIIPARQDDVSKIDNAIKKNISNYTDFIVSTEGDHPATARNAGASRARGTYLLFIDADMAIPPLDCMELEQYGYDLATALYDTIYDPLVAVLQNIYALTGNPFSYYGGFMWVRKSVFDMLGGFRRMPAEDVEFANRAWKLGYKINTFPFHVEHTRYFRWANTIGNLITNEGVWGMP